MDLVIVTGYNRFRCTGVEAGAFQVAMGWLPSQTTLREAILVAAEVARNGDEGGPGGDAAP